MINVSEFFYSIQGEGQFQGYPSVFFRMRNCNLFCGQPTNEAFTEKSEGAKWVCDTIPAWMKGKEMSFEEIYKIWLELGYIERLKEGAHLVLTGGEPLLQESALGKFLHFLIEKGVDSYVEVETNGSLEPTSTFSALVDRFNVSAKLSNSGNNKGIRYNKEALKFHVNNPNSIFKFVVLDDEDVEEIFRDFIVAFNIPKKKIWLMPGAYDREELWKNAPKIAELCKKFGFKMSSRMHVEIWDRVTGV